MKGKKNNRKKIFISLILILVGFVYLYFNGFSYPGNIHISQAYLIKEGADGDVLLFDQNMELDTFIAGGRILMKNKEILQKGTYEK